MFGRNQIGFLSVLDARGCFSCERCWVEDCKSRNWRGLRSTLIRHKAVDLRGGVGYLKHNCCALPGFSNSGTFDVRRVSMYVIGAHASAG